MKKSVILMAGFLAMALAGSAQAATMFAVQNAGGTADMATISDAGDIAGATLNVKGAVAAGLANVPGSVPLTAGVGALHVGTKGNTFTSASGTYQHVGYPTVSGGATYAPTVASNFSFYRINQNDQTLAYSLPAANNALGYLNFGTVDVTLAPDSASYRKNTAQIWVKAEPATATNPGAWGSITNTPSYFQFVTAHWTGAAMALTEKFRISSDGKVGIGTSPVNLPTSVLHVVGLPVFANNAAAVAGGLTAGAFYRTGGDPDLVSVVH